MCPPIPEDWITDDEAEDGTDRAATKLQPEWLSILAGIQPYADRYNSTCHYALIVWHDPFWLRFILATWQQQVEDAQSERMWARVAKKQKVALDAD